MIRLFLISIFSFLVLQSFAQNNTSEQLNNLSNLEGIERVDELNKISRAYWYSNPGESITYGKQALKAAISLEYNKGEAVANNNLGVIHKNLGDYPKALEYHFQALKIREELEDKDGIAASCSNIGTVYRYQKKYEEALKFQFRCLEYDEKSGVNEYIASTLGSIGSVYVEMRDSLQSLNHLTKAVEFAQKSKKSSSISAAKEDLGKAYLEFNNSQKAEPLLLEALESHQLIDNAYGVSSTYYQLGRLYYTQKDFISAETNALQGLQIANSLALKPRIKELSKLLHEVYEAESRFEESLFYHKQFKVYQDSILNEENLQRANALSFAYEMEKRQQEIELLNQSRALQRIINFALGSGFILLFGLAFLLYRGNNLKKKKNKELELQAEEIASQRDFIDGQNKNLKVQKAQVEKSHENIKTISQIGRELSKHLSSSRIIEAVYEQVKLLMPAEAFGIGILTEDGSRINFLGFISKGQKEPDHYDLVSDKSKLSVICFSNKKTLFTNNLSEEYSKIVEIPEATLETYQPNDTAGEIPQSLIYVPLEIDGRAIGVLTIQSYRNNVYSENDVILLDTLAGYIAIALDNAKAYQLIRNEKQIITDSIRYAERIQQSILPRNELMKQSFRDFFVIFKPKDIVSGDFYWLTEIDNKIFFALVDCTGHGVPGAFMSLIGNSLLNRIILEKQIFSPAKILSELHNGISKILQQEFSENQDGMDLSLIKIEGNRLTYAGAKGKAYLKVGGTIELLKSDRINIGGKYMKVENLNFTETHRILSSEDILYLTTDGYIDAANPSRKRFTSPKLKSVIQNIDTCDLASQKEIFLNALYDHKQDAEQRDDITFIALKI